MRVLNANCSMHTSMAALQDTPHHHTPELAHSPGCLPQSGHVPFLRSAAASSRQSEMAQGSWPGEGTVSLLNAK